MTLRNIRYLSALSLFLTTLISKTYAYDPISRWGQATVVVNDALYVFGGKTDEFNSFSYTSAPNTNDILYLSLSSSFPAASPPWELVSSSSNSTTSQGPALAWATLSALSLHEVLAFGGLPDPNSDIVNVGRGDSAFILDVMNRLGPQWRLDSDSVPLNQPIRRIHHSTVTLLGHVFIFGGERADGSRTCLSDNWVFDPSSNSFTQLPGDNGPPGLCGPVSIPLPDGRILVFGGFSSSDESLLPFSTIYVLDTTRTPFTWSTLEVASEPLPPPRRGFASALISSTRILIHGGADASSQTSLSDGWLLDLSRSPATWTEVPTLSRIGARRDHFAVPVGQHVVFGFGYSSSSPAPPEVQIYDVENDSFVPEYTPPPISATLTRTLPTPSSTSESSTFTKKPPTSTGGPSAPGTPGDDPHSNSQKSRTTAIAVGTAVGALALLVLLVAAFYYRRHRHRRFWDERRFAPISPRSPFNDNDNDDDSQIHRNIPRAGGFNEERREGTILKTLGIAGILGTFTRNVRDSRERRNMLEDEDEELGTWSNERRKDGTNGSAWSLLSFLGGTRGSREASVTGHSTTSSTPWREKIDPFSDGAGMVRDNETGFMGAAAVRPKNRREASYVSTRSALSYNSYTDPFSDPIQEERREPSDTSYNGDPPVRLVNPRGPPLALLHTSLPLEHVGHTLSPLSERTSQSTLANPESSSASSNDHVSSSRFSTVASHTTSGTSNMDPPPRSPTLLSNMLALPTESKVRRSDSWWSKIGRRTSLSDSSRSPVYTALRDPNPPPRLVTIDESVHSHSPDKSVPSSKRSSPGSAEVEAQMVEQHQRDHSGNGPYPSKHGKSMSSLRTTDTEVIERMAGTMEVVQRAKSGSQRSDRRSTDSTNLSLETDGSGDRHVGGEDFGDLAGYTSPTEMDPHESIVPHPRSRSRTPPVAYYRNVPQPVPSTSSPPGLPRPLPPAPSGGVAARIQEFERRNSQEQSNHRTANRGSVDYGLVPRRSLFLANPDRRTSRGSSDS